LRKLSFFFSINLKDVIFNISDDPYSE